MKALLIVLALLVLAVGAAWWKLRGPEIPYETLEARYAGPASRFVDLPGGFRAHYEDFGEPPGAAGSDPASPGASPGRPPLVLLHGFGDSFTSWEGWVAELKGQFHVISVDFPGHGLTRAPDGYVLNGADLADYVDLLADRLGWPPFAVAGNSMGGGVAWQLAVRHPGRVRALILVDAAGFPNEKPPAQIPLAFKILKYSWGRAVLRNIDNRPLIDEGLKADVYDKALITPALVDRWAEFQRAPGHRAILMSLNLAGTGGASVEVLRAITVPTLVLWGENDVLLEPVSAVKFTASIPGAKLITYPRVGHLPQIEIPQRSAADVATFLRSVP